MKKRKDLRLQKHKFPVVADMLGIWEEVADESDLTDMLGSYTAAQDDAAPSDAETEIT